MVAFPPAGDPAVARAMTARINTEHLTPAALDATYVPTGDLPRPTLFVIVDTEEEFDWGAPLSRAQTTVRAMRNIERLQQVLNRHRVRPTYVIDYPVATQEEGHGPLLAFRADGNAEIGAHLHPWVTPPYEEDVTPRNSFGFRLGALEFEKLRVLRDAIQSIGVAPTVFKAGRYGFGETTADALEALGFDIDVSINPRMDFSAEGGPDFGRFDTKPFFFGRSRRLLEVPCSTDYVGVAGALGHPLHTFADRSAMRRVRAVGILSRLGIVNKVMLSPEGNTLAEMTALTRSLMRRGVRTFSLTLHSPSVMPGCTPYVRSDTQLREFLDRIDEYCAFFLGEAGGVASTPMEFFTQLRPQPLTGVTPR
jgi:hypothetical protein